MFPRWWNLLTFHVWLLGSPQNENLNLLVWIKFLNLFLYSSKGKLKNFWSEQNVTGLGPEDWCSSLRLFRYFCKWKYKFLFLLTTNKGRNCPVYVNISYHVRVLNSETCLNRTSSRPTFVFGIERYSVYTGFIYKDFLHWDFFL